MYMRGFTLCPWPRWLFSKIWCGFSLHRGSGPRVVTEWNPEFGKNKPWNYHMYHNIGLMSLASWYRYQDFYSANVACVWWWYWTKMGRMRTQDTPLTAHHFTLGHTKWEPETTLITKRAWAPSPTLAPHRGMLKVEAPRVLQKRRSRPR
jgi:hypothetical protein